MNDHPVTDVQITEVGPRDGLQNEPLPVSTEHKVAMIDMLSRSGLSRIEVSSFVSPRAIPQLSDAVEVFAEIRRHEGVEYSALVPNIKGMERAIQCDVDSVAVFTSASESFCRNNINTDIDGSLQRFEPVLASARDNGIPVRGYISCVVACPYEGRIDSVSVRVLAERLLGMGVSEIDLGDTIGVATPADIEQLMHEISTLLDPSEIVLHLHDTNGLALECAMKGYEMGARKFDSSCGGLGGCPYAPGAAGNLSTERLVQECLDRGIESGIDPELVAEAARLVSASDD